MLIAQLCLCVAYFTSLYCLFVSSLRLTCYPASKDSRYWTSRIAPARISAASAPKRPPPDRIDNDYPDLPSSRVSTTIGRHKAPGTRHIQKGPTDDPLYPHPYRTVPYCTVPYRYRYRTRTAAFPLHTCPDYHFERPVDDRLRSSTPLPHLRCLPASDSSTITSPIHPTFVPFLRSFVR